MIIKDKSYYLKLLDKNNPPLKNILGDQSVVIYGAGRLGKSFARNLIKKNVKVVSFIDSNKNLRGKRIFGIPIINLITASKRFKEYPIVIASVLYGNEIYNLLKKNKFKFIYPSYYLGTVSKLFNVPGFNGVFNSFFVNENQSKIVKVFKLLKDKESKRVLENLIKFRLIGNNTFISKIKSDFRLFKEQIVCPIGKNEIYVDCGAYDGDTIKLFGSSSHWKFNHIYAFEPDKINYNKMQFLVEERKLKSKIDTLKMGVYDKTGLIGFSNNGTVDSKVISNDNESPKTNKLTNSIRVIKLDDFFKNKKPPTLIKMDIEGSEMYALKGAKYIIKKYKPKLAISIYHLPSDLWRIILLIKSYNSKYKFYVRHFTQEYADTMCFAI